MMIPSSFFFYPSFPINKTTCSLKHFLSQVPLILKTFLLFPWSPFLGSPETFRAYFGWHNSLCIFTTKASRGTKLCKVFLNFYSLYNMWTDQLYRVSRSEFHEWLFGPEKFSGFSRNGPHPQKYLSLFPIFLSLGYLLFLVAESIIQSRLVFHCFQQSPQEFPCSLKINASVPVFPKTPGRGSLLQSLQSYVTIIRYNRYNRYNTIPLDYWLRIQTSTSCQ